MRLFVAIDLDGGIKEKIRVMEQEMIKKDVDVKFVEPKNLHLTLKFLGEVGEGKIGQIEEKIEKVLKGSGPFDIAIEGFGYFGKPSYIRTLWFDLTKGKERVAELIERLNIALDYVRHEGRPVTTHITIGRVKSGKKREILLKEAERLRNVKIGEVIVKEVKLKESILTKKGPIYRDVKVFKLG